MTTNTMIAAMTLMALSIGAGSKARSLRTIAVVGRLTTSTLLTLVVIPLNFTYIDSWHDWIFSLVQGGKKTRRQNQRIQKNAVHINAKAQKLPNT